MGDKTLFLLIGLSTKYKLRNIIFGTLIAIISVFITFLLLKYGIKFSLMLLVLKKKAPEMIFIISRKKTEKIDFFHIM